MITDKIIILNQTTLASLKEKTELQIVKKFFGVAIKILGADFGFVWLKKRGSLNMELAHKSANLPFTPTVPRKSGTTSQVLNKKQSLLIDEIAKSNTVKSFAQKYLKSLAIIPITYKDHTYGNMYICFKSERNFTQEDQALCDSIGNTTAQTVTIGRLNQNLHNIKHTLDHTPEPLLIFDPVTRSISYFNKSLLTETGIKNFALNRTTINQIIHPSFHKLFEKRLKHILKDKIQSSLFEVALKTAGSRKLPVEILLQYVNLPGQTPHLLAIFSDLREKKKSQEQIRKAAFHDTLTQLPNRFLFTQRLEALLKSSERLNRRFALIFMDLDRFKDINDTAGHLVGDSLLRQVGLRLKKNIKRRDLISRFGGDEFVIVTTNLHAANQADRVVRRIQKAFKKPFALGPNQEAYVNFSAGISTYPKDGTTAEALLKNADNALYRAKQRHGNSFDHAR